MLIKNSIKTINNYGFVILESKTKIIGISEKQSQTLDLDQKILQPNLKNHKMISNLDELIQQKNKGKADIHDEELIKQLGLTNDNKNKDSVKKVKSKIKIIKTKDPKKHKEKNSKGNNKNLNGSDYSGKSNFNDYSKHTEMYKNFFNDYMKSIINAYNSVYDLVEGNSKKSKQRVFTWGEEIISYEERKDFVKVLHMNTIMGAPNNSCDPALKTRYEFWKYASKFNQLMSFMMYDAALR